MPPRIPTLSVVSSTSTIFQSPAGAVAAAPWGTQSSASFSTTASCHAITRHRRAFLKWIRTEGKKYKWHQPGETNYLSPMRRDDSSSYGPTKNPFPLNPQFHSQAVLDERAREMIWERVMLQHQTLKQVSAELGVDINRVGAIVRLKEVEKDWQSKGKSLAKPYAKAILSMLPTKSFQPGIENPPFEAINELHVHSHTMKQIFWPTSESRHFTREDAAKAFHRKMLSTDKRVPHPELIQMERDIHEGKPMHEAKATFLKAAEESERAALEATNNQAKAAEQATTKINTKRFEFRFREINAENVGADGRRRNAVGYRYGAPKPDRMKGLVRHPTSVPEKDLHV